MKKNTKHSRLQANCMLYVMIVGSLFLNGCLDKMLGFEKKEKEPVTVTVSGTVTDAVEQTPIPEAVIYFFRRTNYEDWEMGGYDYEYLNSYYADDNGAYQFSSTLSECSTWSYYVEASKSTDSLVYYSEDRYLSCSSGTYIINFAVNSYGVSY